MDHFSLTEDQLKKISKKDAKFLIEIQKEIHSQKEIFYSKLRNYYWIVSVSMLIAFMIGFVFSYKGYAVPFLLQIISSFILVMVGGRLYYIDKPAMIQKAFAKSKKKHLDAIEIEILEPKDLARQKKGVSFIVFGCIIYFLAFILIILS